MSITDKIHDFEKKLEGAIKSAFEQKLKQELEFEISVDYDTHSRLNSVIAGLDLEVYGMSVTPSEFTITFEFCSSFQAIDCESKPRYCRLEFRNDGNYYFTLTENDLKKDWYLSITNVFFNPKAVPEDVMEDCLTQLNHTLLLKILSN